MSENKPLIDAETREKLKERGRALQAGVTELSDEQADAVAGGTGGTKSFQDLAYEDKRYYSVDSRCYDGCEPDATLKPHQKSLWAKAAGGRMKYDIKCYNCGMLYAQIDDGRG